MTDRIFLWMMVLSLCLSVFSGNGTEMTKALLNAAQDYLRVGKGRLIMMSSQHDVGTFDFRKAVDKGIEIRIAHPNYSNNERDDFRRAAALINNHVFQSEPIVTHVFMLSEIQKAFETLEHKPAGYMKGVVIPD